MAEYNIRVGELKHGGKHPVAKAIVLLKSLIDDEAIIYDLDLALTEATANVVRHAYPDEEDGPLSIRIRTTKDQSVEITVTDQGSGMQYDLPNGELPDQRSEHGRGIPLMTSLCDRVDFSCNGKANVVTMTKTIPPAAWRD